MRAFLFSSGELAKTGSGQRLRMRLLMWYGQDDTQGWARLEDDNGSCLPACLAICLSIYPHT
jgi:hypothetical protein